MLRWTVPFALLVIEYLFLSILVDLPLAGPARPLVESLRLAVPIVIGTAAAGWLIGRSGGGAAAVPGPALPPWRPGPMLAAHLAAFAATATLAYRLLAPGVPPPAVGPMLALTAAGAISIVLALATAAPLRWTARTVLARWKLPLLALGGGLLSWRMAVAAESLWGALSTMTLHAAAWILRLVADEVILEVDVQAIGLPGFEVEVAPVCSGADGLGMVILFQALWLSLARSRIRLRRAAWLLPLGAVLALAANAVRIASLIWVGAHGNPELAMGGLHSKLGWFLFLAIALGSVAAAERLPWLRRAGSETSPAVDLAPAAAVYVAPLLAAIVAALGTSVWATGSLDRLYAVRIGAGLAALLLVRRALPTLVPSRSAVPALLGLAVGVVWIFATGGNGSGLAGALAQLGPAERTLWIAARVVGSIVLIPMVEELAFRGFLLPWLVSVDFEAVSPRTWNWRAALLSSLAFAALHQQLVAGVVAGLAFAAARAYRGRLGDAVLSHAAANACISAAVLLGGRWNLWG